MAYPKIYQPVIGIMKRHTEKAILLVISDPEALTPDDEEIENWIPRSQISDIKPAQDIKGNSIVMMSEWIIGQKDLKRFVRSVAQIKEVMGHTPVPKTPAVKPHIEVDDDDIPY